MYEAWVGADISVSFALIVFWALAAWQTGRVVRQSEPPRLARGAVVALVLLAVAGLPALAKAVLTGLLLAQGWLFGANNLLFAVPMVVVPAVLSFWWTFPALLALRRAGRAEGGPVAERRAELARLRVALPPRLTAIGGVFAAWFAFFRQPVPSYLDEIALYGALYGLAALAQVLKLRRAAARVAGGEAFPSWGVRASRAGATAMAFIAVVVLGLVWAASASKLPGSFNMAEHGGGTHAAAGAEHGPGPGGSATGTPITTLTGPRDGTPAKKFSLTAQTTEIALPSGAKIAGWTYNGTVPGPLLRVRQNELVEIELINKDVRAGVSLHWHGVDVPNAEDGVPGLTQDAVPVGGRHVYRFRAPDVGSYWYHSHQVSSEQVRGGLYGAFVVDPPAGPDAGVTDLPVVVHTFKGQHQTMNGVDQLVRQAVKAGTKVRLRLVNTDSQTRRFGLTGTPFRVTGIDGTPVNGPTDLTDDKLLVVGGGARYDVEFTMPATPVRLSTTLHPDKGLLLSPDGTGELAARLDGEPLDANSYGTPAPTEFGPGTKPAQTVEWILDNHMAFFDGSLKMVYTANGDLFPDVPPITVREGDLVKMRFVNRSFVDHPMHLHGHHVLVLSRNGKAASGSPQWLDTVTVHPGETYEIMFKADNPGIWMDHCHDLDHAAVGMVMHLNYEGYRTPFVTGRDTPNQPE